MEAIPLKRFSWDSGQRSREGIAWKGTMSWQDTREARVTDMGEQDPQRQVTLPKSLLHPLWAWPRGPAPSYPPSRSQQESGMESMTSGASTFSASGRGGRERKRPGLGRGLSGQCWKRGRAWGGLVLGPRGESRCWPREPRGGGIQAPERSKEGRPGTWPASRTAPHEAPKVAGFQI